MTKKHFKSLAEMYKSYTDSGKNGADPLDLYKFLEGFCTKQNSLFDRQRFYNACHGLEYKK